MKPFALAAVIALSGTLAAQAQNNAGQSGYQNQAGATTPTTPTIFDWFFFGTVVTPPANVDQQRLEQRRRDFPRAMPTTSGLNG